MGCTSSHNHIAPNPPESVATYDHQSRSQSHTKSTASTNAANEAHSPQRTLRLGSGQASPEGLEKHVQSGSREGASKLSPDQPNHAYLTKLSGSQSKAGWKYFTQTWSLMLRNSANFSVQQPRISGQILMSDGFICESNLGTTKQEAQQAYSPIQSEVRTIPIEAHYDLLEVLGQGFFGEVRRGIDKRTSEVVAIKTMKRIPELTEDSQKMDLRVEKMFVNEITILSKLFHPNIVRLKAAYKNFDTCYAVLEYCDGQNLLHYIHRIVFETRHHGKVPQRLTIDESESGRHFESAFPHQSVQRVLQQACGPCTEVELVQVIAAMLRPIAYLHSKNYVHRDIKAQNFLFVTANDYTSGIYVKERHFHDFVPNSDKDPATGNCLHQNNCNCLKKVRVVLIDFGMTTKVEAGKMLHASCGTPHYVAPEILAHSYGTKVDIWALGIITYLFVYGRYPYTGSTRASILNKIKRTVPKYFVSPRGPSSWALDFIKKCLRRDPVRRMTAMEALQHPWLRPGNANPNMRYPILTFM